MRYQFTPGAERALEAAALWHSRIPSDQLEPVELLLGLLSEPECRAALILAEQGIDERAVLQVWPALVKLDTAEPPGARLFSPAVDAAMRAAEARLFEYARPLQLATEHLLLGLVAEPSDVCTWLRQRGLDADALEADIHRRAGHQPGPLPIDFGDEPIEEDPESVPRDEELAVLRVIDAAANRAGEGLRVLEDYVRFIQGDAFLTRECKQLRHDLAAALAGFSQADRHAARETQADVGTTLTAGDEQARADASRVVTASFKRVEQALRSLEEYAKVIDPAVAATVEQLRYRTYTLERVVDIGRASLERLANARLYVLIDGGRNADEFVDLARTLLSAGVHVLQLRDKRLPDGELLGRARLLAGLVRGSHTLFIMNDRADLARLAGADGVHLGQEDLSVKDARAVLGPRPLIGVSTHSIEQARRAVLDGANYLGVGPTFASATKEFTQFPGIELLGQVAGEIRLPAFAIGGIDQENLPQVFDTGFVRIAVSSAVCRGADPAAAAERLLKRLAERDVRSPS